MQANDRNLNTVLMKAEEIRLLCEVWSVYEHYTQQAPLSSDTARDAMDFATYLFGRLQGLRTSIKNHTIAAIDKAAGLEDLPF